MESKFTGGLLGMIGIWILQALIITFTLGIGTPWAICLAERWRVLLRMQRSATGHFFICVMKIRALQ